MRVRDLRWYILASIIIIISYAAVAVCFYLSISNGKVEGSMKELALRACKNEATMVTDKLNEYYDMFINDTNDSLVYYEASKDNGASVYNIVDPEDSSLIIETRDKNDLKNKIFEKCPNQTGLSGVFVNIEGNKIVYGQSTQIEKPQVPNPEYYFYFYKSTTSPLKTNNDDIVVRVSSNDFFKNIGYNIVIYNDSGYVKYSNMESDNEYKKVDISSNVAELLGNNYLNEYDDNNELNRAYTIRGIRSVVAAIDVNYIGQFAIIMNIDDVFLGIAWVYQQALIFYISGVVVSILMLVILIFGCRKTSQLLRADRHALQKTEAIVIRIDTQGNLIFSNKTFKKLYGITREVNIRDFIDVETNEPILSTIKKNKAFICEVPLDEMRDNVKYLQLSPLYISRSYYLMGTDVTIDYNESKRLQLMSGRNEVTNCENGFILSNRFDKIIDENAGMDICFVECNIHKHSDMIQVFGKTTYNLAMIEFLKILRETFVDLAIYQIDDFKFMVVYPNTDINEVTGKVNELLETLRRPITVKVNNIYLNVKIAAFNLKHGTQEESIVFEDENKKKLTFNDIETKLDLAYRNIQDLSSKDYVVYEPAMDSVILATDEMEKDIETGLIDKEFQMWLQPQFDIVNNRIDGFEALIRWMNPKYKDKSPQIFIELAEKRGHMLDIGRFVITESFKLAKRLEPYNIHVSVNISPVQLLQVGFVQQLIDEFNRNQLKVGAVAIEITETLLMGSFKLVAEKLRILRDNGFHIHLDDFCTGYSSMLYLKDLPVDTLKIDKEFTKFIVNNKFNENIVRTICGLGNSLNLDLICEGVETQEQSDMVKKMGCRVIQGWLIGKAMPYDQAVELLEKYNRK